SRSACRSGMHRIRQHEQPSSEGGQAERRRTWTTATTASRSYRDPGWWGASRHQDGDEITEEGPAPAPGVVHELEEGEIERQLLLRDAPVRAQPGAQQRPDALHGVDVDLAEPVAIVIARVLAPGVAHRLV